MILDCWHTSNYKYHTIEKNYYKGRELDDSKRNLESMDKLTFLIFLAELFIYLFIH